ncbi:MAG: hypothetical protein HW376_1578, partial [candidate division NC10 bacterium]|nr:hypothetical protein [candidate division NC10 bacterium]
GEPGVVLSTLDTSAWLEACRVTSNRVHGIMILVGAGLALPNQASDPEKGAASSAPTIQILQ